MSFPFFLFGVCGAFLQQQNNGCFEHTWKCSAASLHQENKFSFLSQIVISSQHDRVSFVLKLNPTLNIHIQSSCSFLHILHLRSHIPVIAFINDCCISLSLSVQQGGSPRRVAGSEQDLSCLVVIHVSEPVTGKTAYLHIKTLHETSPLPFGSAVLHFSISCVTPWS